MPTHKGIKLSVISQWGLQIHPEFAHPDSSQFTFRSPNLNHSPILDGSPVSKLSDSKADKLLGRPSTVAVYIPSVSGARFWILYEIVDATAAISPWYFFKLYMNGRLITSWGVNPITKPKGQVMRGLFDPSERWNYREDGIVFKNNGTEARPFFFTKETTQRSTAEDGGLIEVHVFRARGRRRRMPRPEGFRGQENWGIAMPSGGLLEKPQDAQFFDWHLQDPKDKPFASFQFHYRTWDSLISQQLVPAKHNRNLLPATPSLLSLNGVLPEAIQEPHIPEPEDNKNEDMESNTVQEGEQIEIEALKQTDEPAEGNQVTDPRDSISSNASNTPWITSVFDDSPDRGAQNVGESEVLFGLKRTNSSYPLRFTNDKLVPTSKFSEAVLDDAEESHERLELSPRPWSEGHKRPLPELPSRSTSLSHGQHSRNSSIQSNAVSITPSLRSHYERNTASPEPPIFGFAKVLPVIASTFGLSPETDPVKKDSGSSLIEESYVDARTEQLAEPLAAPTEMPAKRPLGGVFSNITLRKHRGRSSPSKPLLSPIKQSPIISSEASELFEEDIGDADVSDDGDGEPSTLVDMTTLSLTESEWMCRTPSPVRNDPERERVSHLWSPSMEKNSFRSSVDGKVPRKRLSEVNLKGFEDLEAGMMGRRDSEVKMRSGNWI